MSAVGRVVVYGPRDAPFTKKVLGALALKGVDHELRQPGGPEDYRRWSPETGLLPAADIEGERVADSGRILDALDRCFPDPPLLAEDSVAAAAQRRLERWVEETFFYYWQRWLRERVERQAQLEGRSEAEAGASALQRTLARLGLSAREIATSRSDVAMGQEFETRLDDLVNFLGGRPYFYGERIGRADLAVHSFLTSDPVRTLRSVSAAVSGRRPLVDHVARVEAAVAPKAAVPVGR